MIKFTKLCQMKKSTDGNLSKDTGNVKNLTE